MSNSARTTKNVHTQHNNSASLLVYLSWSLRILVLWLWCPSCYRGDGSVCYLSSVTRFSDVQWELQLIGLWVIDRMLWCERTNRMKGMRVCLCYRILFVLSPSFSLSNVLFTLLMISPQGKPHHSSWRKRTSLCSCRNLSSKH